MPNAPTPEEAVGAATRSAVHLEMRDGYMLGGSRFQAWQRGHRDEPQDRDSWWNPWHQVTSDATGRGVVIRRARVVSEPLSDYVRFEYDVTFSNVAAGEHVRWLPRTMATDLALPGNDSWLIDDRTLLVLHFAGNGDYQDSTVVDDPTVVELYRSAFEAVWERAIPHEEYEPR